MCVKFAMKKKIDKTKQENTFSKEKCLVLVGIKETVDKNCDK